MPDITQGVIQVCIAGSMDTVFRCLSQYKTNRNYAIDSLRQTMHTICAVMWEREFPRFVSRVGRPQH